MKTALNMVRTLAVVALVAQAVTPWSMLHLELSNGTFSQDADHIHCPSSQALIDELETSDNHDEMSSACERACGLTLDSPSYLTFTVIPNLPKSIITRPDSLQLYVSAVPKPPPIA